jgi:predicted RNA methylase
MTRPRVVKPSRVPKRLHAVGGVDPRTLPPGTAYPCDDPRIGTRGVGRRVAGTILACATPPEGQRGSHYAVGEVERGSTLTREARAREKARQALRDRYEGEDFDARPARRPRPTRTPRALPAPEVFTGEIVGAPLPLRALPSPVGTPLRRAALWGGRAVQGARDAPLAHVGIARDARTPEQFPRPSQIADDVAQRPTELVTSVPGVVDPHAAPRVIVEATALAAVLRGTLRQASIGSYQMGRKALYELLGALEARLAQEHPTPGTHFPLRIERTAAVTWYASRAPVWKSHPMPFAGMRFTLTLDRSPDDVKRGRTVSTNVVPLRARVRRMGDGELGVLIDLDRAADGALPRWFPGMPAQNLPDRALTAAQQRRIGEVVGSKSWRPLRVDLHPDGRARVVYVALTAPHTHFLASEKPPTDGALRAESLSPIGTWLREGHALDDSPHWRTVMDLRLAPSPEAAAKPTFTRTTEEYLDATHSKKRGDIVSALGTHWTHVAQALRTGHPVAPEVLAEYPKLAAFYAASARTGRSRAEVLAEKEAVQRADDHADDPDVTVHWSVQEGLLLYTRGKDPKIIAAIKDLRNTVAAFKWSGHLGAWFRPQSVGVSVSTVPIDRVAQALRKAGLVVRVERGETTDLGTANERRQDHKFWRADLYADRAGDALVRGTETEQRAERLRDDIPVGAPTRRAERAEARADRLDEKAADDFSYAQHAAGAAQNLAARAASYDVTATITRKEAERRVDAFARFFGPKVKGLVGAEKVFSKKTENLSEYRIAWGLLYPLAAGVAAQVVYDGRVITVRPLAKRARDGWEHVQLYDGRTSLHDRSELPEPTLRRDVTTLDAEQVFALVVDALPKVAKAARGTDADPGEARPDSGVAWLRALTAFAQRRVAKALDGVILLKSVDRWAARHERGERLRVTVVGAHLSRHRESTATPRLCFVVMRGTGQNAFEIGGYPTIELAVEPSRSFVQRVDTVTVEKLYQPVSETVAGAEVPVALDGLTVAEAWELVIAHARALLSGTPLVPPKPAKGRPSKPAPSTAEPEVVAGRGAVERLARETTDAAATARAAEVSSRVERVREEAGDHLAEHLRELDATNATRGLLEAVRAAGNDLGFYPTPPTLAAYAVSLARITPGARVLEPSAGTGSLVEALVEAGARVTALELQADRAAYLRAAWEGRGVKVHAADFLSFGASSDFDAVVMNPPFSIAGRRYTDIEHVRHAMSLVRPGGRVVAIMAAATPTRDEPRALRFREDIRAWHPAWEPVEAKRFRLSGTDVPTVLLTLTRPA